jgi:hypothetical protein
MNYEQFYKKIFAPLNESIGPIDRNTIVAIMGFDGGGPLNFNTIGRDTNSSPITYVSCELSVREEQIPTESGGYRYELLASCDSEKWVRQILTNLGRMSLEVAFDHGHTIDIGPIVNENLPRGKSPTIQGVLLQEECTALYQGERYGVLRCIGITRPEMEFGLSVGTSVLVSRLEECDFWPNTLTQRESII